MHAPKRPLMLTALLSAMAALPLACGGGGGGNGGSGGTVAGAHLDVSLDGSTTAYGTVVSGMSDGDTISVRIRNQGTQSFSLSPALFSASDDMDVRDFAMEFPSDYVAPSGPSTSALVADLPSPLQLTEQDPVFGLTLLPDRDGMQSLANFGGGELRMGNFALPGVGEVELHLHKLPSPWQVDGKLMVDGVHQPELLAQIQQDYSAWSGAIAGQPNSHVFLSFSSHGCQGWVQTHEDIFHVMAEPTALRDWSNPQVRIMRESELIGSQFAAPGGGECQPIRVSAEQKAKDMEQGSNTPNAGSPQRKQRHAGSNALSALCRMALETDYDYLGVKFSDDQAAATTYATQLVAAVGHQFQAQVQTRVTLAYLALYTTSADPWTVPDSGGTTLQLLEEFRDAWLSNWPVDAEAAHLLCAGMNAGGVSYLDEVGDQRWAFSVSTFIQGNLNWSNFPFSPSPFNWDFIVVAHETGHLFNADHTHNYCPPFDECAKSSAWGACQDETNCTQKGTLLSYCHTCVGGTNKIQPYFEPYIANEMRKATDEHLDAWTIEPGQTLTFEIEYEPLKSGDSNVTLSWTHNAANVASPFLIEFSGTD